MAQLCKVCLRYRSKFHKHHKLSQSYRKYYPECIDDRKNIQIVCIDCHTSHASPDLTIWDELEFSEALGIKPRTKVGRIIWERLHND